VSRARQSRADTQRPLCHLLWPRLEQAVSGTVYRSVTAAEIPHPESE